jgi:hypothetical protein
MELALFVQKQMQLGTTPAEIAKRLGKSRGWLTLIGALVDPPDWLMNLYRSGRCRGITELYELCKLHHAQPDAIEAWLADRRHVTRADIQDFKETIKPATTATASIAKEPSAERVETEATAAVPAPSSGGLSKCGPAPSTARNEAASTRPCDLMLVGEVAGASVRVLLDAARAGDDEVLVTDLGSARRRAVAIASIVSSLIARHTISAAGTDQSNLTPGRSRIPRLKVAVKLQPCRACLATTRQSEKPQLPCSNKSAA